MFALFCLFAFVAAQDCTTATACPDRSTLAVCDAGVTNYVDPNSPCKCWLCRPRDLCVPCTAPTVKCADNQMPSKCTNCSDARCCPTCIAAPCATCAPLGADAPACPAPALGTAAPVPDCHVCPNCTTSNPCANFDFTKCTPLESLPDCDGTNSQPATACCRTCKPPPPCSSTQLDACKASMASLSVCASTSAFVFDPKTCCYPCRPPERPPTDPCTATTAANALTTIPDCQPTEVPVPVPSLCSYSCKEPGTACDPGKLTDRTAIPVCPDGTAPVFAGCIPNCKPAPPVCAPVCADATQKCIPAAAGAVASGPRCVNIDQCVTFLVAGIATGADPTDVFGTVVDRHCEDPTAAAKSRCDLYQKILRDSLVCKKTDATKTDGGVTYIGVKCCHAADPNPAVGRRLLDSSGLLNDAAGNQGAVGSLSFDSTAGQSGASAVTAFAGLSMLFAFVVY